MTQQVDSKRSNVFAGNLSVEIIVDRNAIGVIPAQDLIECWFIEDIYSRCITGKLRFYDTIGLLENGPFTGSEIVRFTYGTEETRILNFVIWETPLIVQAAPNRSTDKSVIECSLVDTSFFRMFYTKKSLSFPKGDTHTQIVKNILMKLIGWPPENIFLEASQDSQEDAIAFPFWSPSDMIQFLLKRTKSVSGGSNTGNSSGYLCYNSTEKTFSVNVKTLNYLFSRNNGVDDVNYIFEGGADREATQNKIFDWSVSGIDQSLLRSVRGGKFRGFDTKSKFLTEFEYTFAQGIKDTILLGKKSILPDISDVNSSHDILGGNMEELKRVVYDEWVKMYCLQFMVDIVAQGNEKRYAGHQIQIDWPSINRQYEKTQKQLNGLYLVKSVTHSFTGHGNNINYLQKMRLIKNAFDASNAANLLNSTKSTITNTKKLNMILKP